MTNELLSGVQSSERMKKQVNSNYDKPFLVFPSHPVDLGSNYTAVLVLLQSLVASSIVQQEMYLHIEAEIQQILLYSIRKCC